MIQLFFILLLVALICGGYFVYQRLKEIEREIRAEQQMQKQEEPQTASQAVDAPVEEKAEEENPVAARQGGLGVLILQAVARTPGVTQVELYADFPDEERRELQRQLRELDREGRVRREKQGSSYRLYPL